MHKKHAKDGLVVISVTLDELSEEGSKERALAFLKEQQADCINLLLDESSKVWQDKLRFIGPPCQYVFNRQGKWVQFNSDEGPLNLHKVDETVLRFLGEK